MGSKKLFALVKWIGGEDDKKYTVGIDIDHIKDFNYEKFIGDDEDPNKIYVVEWRRPTKKPPGGWKCYSAQVIAVSGSLIKLNKKMEAIDGIQSPRRVVHEVIEGSGSSKNEILVNNTESTANESEMVQSDIDTEQSPPVKRKKLFDDSEKSEDILICNDKKSEATGSVISSPNNSNKDLIDPEIVILEDTGVKPGGSEFVTKQELSEAITMALQKVLSAIPSTSSGITTLSANLKMKNSRTKKRDMVELGEPGSNIFVTSDQWRAAEATQSFTAMTTSLLVSVFNTDELIKSNYKGGPPKIAKDKTIVHTGLKDTDKLKAIKETVKQRFKKQFNDVEFGKCINVKCNKLRSSHNPKKKAEKPEDPPENDEENDNKNI